MCVSTYVCVYETKDSCIHGLNSPLLLVFVCAHSRHVGWQVWQQPRLAQHAHGGPPVVALQHGGVLHQIHQVQSPHAQHLVSRTSLFTIWRLGLPTSLPYLVEGGQVVLGLDEEGLVDARVVYVMGGGRHQAQKDVQRTELLRQLQRMMGKCVACCNYTQQHSTTTHQLKLLMHYAVKLTLLRDSYVI